jgi:hypothetical protein
VDLIDHLLAPPQGRLATQHLFAMQVAPGGTDLVRQLVDAASRARRSGRTRG